MDQSDADWGDWSLNNDVGMNPRQETPPVDGKQDLVDDEQRLTAYDEDPQKEPVEFRMYDDESGLVSGSGDSEASDLEDMEEGGELQKELLSRSERGPLGQLQPQGGGMVMCEFCGKLGVRDAFYSKTKRFCSVNCSKSFAGAQKDGKPTPFTLLQASMAQAKPKSSHLKSQYVSHGGVKFGSEVNRTFDWSSYMNQTRAMAAPVSCFKHCLMAESWENIAVGMKVEVTNTDCDVQVQAYWIATVIQLAGYRAQMRYEGFGNDASLDFWMNLCTRDIHPVGWCAANRKPLVPPRSIQHKYLDWKDFLVKRLTGARTLPQHFYNKVKESLQNTPIKKSMFVEVVDKLCVSAMRVGKVDEVIGGRLKLHYVDSKVENDEFWCHQESPLVHPVGWSQLVNHKLHASTEYKAESLNKAVLRKYSDDDCTPQMFRKIRDLPNGGKFQVGMKLEAIDPLNLSSICVATVKKVLRNNYLMIGIDGSSINGGSDWFCYHATSPCIFPVGFCEINKLDLTPPRGHAKGQFQWFDYLRQTKSVAAPVKLFDKDIPRHGFKVGMKLEAVDLMEPRLICVATVKQVVGRLLRIHFDGWEVAYDQWVDCHSVDVYPVGWCEMVGYLLQGPRPREPSQTRMIVPKKKKSKSQMYRGPRRKRKHLSSKGLTPQIARHSLDSDVSLDSFSTATSDRSHLSLGNTGLIQPAAIKDEPMEVNQSTGSAEVVADSMDVSPPAAIPPIDAQRVPSSTSSGTSSLASSMPSIANMLSSPVKQQQVKDISSPAVPASSSVSGAMVHATLNISPSSSPSRMFIHTMQPIGSPSSSPGPAPPQVLMHYIPRVIPGEPDSDCVVPTVTLTKVLMPAKWAVHEVCHFLRINDCAAHCDSFRKKGIDGQQFLALTKEQMVNLTGMKVGPSLKIYDLIQALKQKLLQQSPTRTSEAKNLDASAKGGTQITASAILKQQGLMQGSSPQQAAGTDVAQAGLVLTQPQGGSTEVSQGGLVLTQHLLKGTGVRSLQAQTTQ